MSLNADSLRSKLDEVNTLMSIQMSSWPKNSSQSTIKYLPVPASTVWVGTIYIYKEWYTGHPTRELHYWPRRRICLSQSAPQEKRLIAGSLYEMVTDTTYLVPLGASFYSVIKFKFHCYFITNNTHNQSYIWHKATYGTKHVSKHKPAKKKSGDKPLDG